VGSNDFEDTIINCKDRNIKSTTTEIKHQDVLFTLFLIKPISNSSSGWFIENTNNIQTGNSSCVFCCLPLSVIKIGRNSDHSVDDFFSEVSL
jgi:hypothetical protein